MEEDEAPDPADISALGAEAKVSDSGDYSDLVEEFWSGHR